MSDDYVELTGSRIGSHGVDPFTSSMTLGQLWQKCIDSPFVGLDPDLNYEYSNAVINVNGANLQIVPETMANSITYPKVQFGFWWEESLRSRIVTTFFTGVSTFLPEWNMNNNQAGDYLPGTPVTVGFPELPEVVYDGEDFPVGSAAKNMITQDYICHLNPAFNPTASDEPKTTGDVPGYKIDGRWQLCGTNYANYNHGSWYETLNPDGNGNFTNPTDDGSQKRFTPGKKFRIKLGQFDLWGSSAEDWSLDECYVIVKVKEFDSSGSPIVFLDPTNDPAHREMPFMFTERFHGTSAYGVFNESFLGDNASVISGKVRPFHQMPADVSCWESINKYATQSPPFFFTSMSVPFASLISAHYKTNFDIFAYNFSEDNAKFPHYSDRYLKEESISTSYELQGGNWVNVGYIRDPGKNTYTSIPNPLKVGDVVHKHSNAGVEDPDEELGALPGAMDSDAYYGYAYYMTIFDGVGTPDFTEPKFEQNAGYYGDLGLDPVYTAGSKTKFETRLVDYVKSPFYWNRVFSSASNSVRTLSGKMSTALIFTEAEYQDIYGVGSPVNSATQAKICWPAYNSYGFNSFGSTVLSHSEPETKTGNTLIGEFLLRSKIVSGFNWKEAADKNVYTWINKTANPPTAKYVPAYDLLDFHRVNNNEVSSSITPQVSLSSMGATASPPSSLTPAATTVPGADYTLKDMLEEPVDVWHKGVKIPIYVRILDYPYSRVLNGNTYQGLGSCAETGASFSVFLSALLGYTASYNQTSGNAGNLKPIDHYSSWHTPGPNTVQQHAGKIDTSHSDIGTPDSTSAPFGVHQGVDDGALFYDAAGNPVSLITNTNVDYNNKYKEVLDANEGALWRYPEAISSPYSFANKNNHLHKIGYVQFPKTPSVGEGYVKEIAMLAVKSGTDDFQNINDSIEQDYTVSHLSADTGTVMLMTGGMCMVIDELRDVMDVETSETQVYSVQAQYAKTSYLGGFKWWNESVPNDFTQVAEPGDYPGLGMYLYRLPQAKYDAFAATINQEDYYALSPIPDASDVDNDGNWLASQPNRTMYEFDDGAGAGSRYNPNSFAAQNHIGDDDIANAYDHAIAVADGISTKLGEFLTNAAMDSMRIKVIDQPYFFAQQKSSADLFGNYRHTSDLDGVTDTVGRFYFYTGHSEFELYPPMTVGIPALLERVENIPGGPTVKSATDTYTPGRADYTNAAAATGKSFLRSFHLLKSANSAMNEHIGINASNGATRSLTIDDTVADGAGVKTISGKCIVSNPPSLSSAIPNRRNSGPNSYMVFYSGDSYDNNVTFSFPMNASGTGHQDAQLTVSGATGLSTSTTASSLTVGFQTSDATGTAIGITLNDKLGLTIPDEISSISHGGTSFPLTESIDDNESAIHAAYQNVLDRAADQAGLDYYKQESWTIDYFITKLMESEEYQSHQALGTELSDPRGDYTKNNNTRSFKSMTKITLSRSSLQMGLFDNYKDGLLWIYKDQSVMYSGAKLLNPAVLNTTFGSVWADDSHLKVSHDAVHKHTYDLVEASYSSTGWAAFDMNQGWFLETSSWSNTLLFELNDGTNLPTPFSKTGQSFEVRGIKKPAITNFSASSVVPNSYKLYMGSPANFINEPSVSVSFDVKVYSDIAYSGSSDSHFYDKGLIELTFEDSSGNPYVKTLSKGSFQTPKDANGTRSNVQFALSYSLSQIIPTLEIPVSAKLIISDEIYAYPAGAGSNNKVVHGEAEDNSLDLDLDANYILNRFPQKTVDVWQFMDAGANWRDFNRACTHGSPSWITQDQLLKGTGSTTLTFSGEDYEGASEGLIYRQRVLYASLCAMVVFNSTNSSDSLRMNVGDQNYSSTQNMINRGVDIENSTAFGPLGRRGAHNNYHSSVPGPLEYNYWSLPGTFSAGKYSDVRSGWCIELTSPTPNDIFESTWDAYGPVSRASVLPPVVYGGRYKKNVKDREYVPNGSGGYDEDQGFGEDQGGNPAPSNNNWGRGDAAMIKFANIGKSRANYLEPCFVSSTKIRGWQNSNLHDFIYDTPSWDPEVKTWQENIDGYVHAVESVDGYGPHVICIRGDAGDDKDRTAIYLNGVENTWWAPWGDANHLNSSSDLWSGGYGSDINCSFMGLKNKGYMGFQQNGATRIVKRVNGVFPGVTYRLYFSAAYRVHYWNMGCRVYVTEPYVGASGAEDTDTEHELSRELIAYGEYHGTANRWINYNVKRNVTAVLGRPWQEGDGYGFTCNFRKVNPYELNSSLSSSGDAGVTQADVLQTDRFKVFYIEFTPKKGSNVVEISFESSYIMHHKTVNWQGTGGPDGNGYSSLSSFNSGILIGEPPPTRSVPNGWVEIKPDDFFDPSEYTKDYIRKWDHPYRGPWESSPRPWRDGHSTFNDNNGAPGGVHLTHAMQRVGTWFLDEIWMTAARPCWVEKVKFKYNVHQGGYLLSIDQGDKANRPVDDVFLCNPNLEVIRRGGIFPEPFAFGSSALMHSNASLVDDQTNGYFLSGQEYEIDIIRQHTHIQNWDPFATDNDNHASKLIRTSGPLVIPWIPGDYHAGLVFGPPNPGLFTLNSSSLNNSARFGLNNGVLGDPAQVHANQNDWRSWMPDSSGGYNSTWDCIYSDPAWNTGAGAVSMPGWIDLMNTVEKNSMSAGEPLIRNPKFPTITPSTLDSSVQDFEIDTSATTPDIYTSYEHTIVADGVRVELPVLGDIFFLDKDKLGNFTGKEASVDFTTGKLYEGSFHLSMLGLSGQHAAITGLEPAGNYSSSSYDEWCSNLPAWSSRNTILPNGKIFLIIQNNSHSSGELGEKISDVTGSSHVRLFTSTALWPWFKDIGADGWGMMELNRAYVDTYGNNPPRIRWWNEGFPATNWKKWQIGSAQNMSPITRGSEYDKYLKNGHLHISGGPADSSGGYRNNKNWIGDYVVVNHGALVNLFLSRPISSSSNSAGSRETVRPAPSNNERSDLSMYFKGDGYVESTHNNNAFRFL